MDHRLDKVILSAFASRSEVPPFSMEQLAPFRRFLDEFLMAQGHVPDWTNPKHAVNNVDSALNFVTVFF